MRRSAVPQTDAVAGKAGPDGQRRTRRRAARRALVRWGCLGAVVAAVVCLAGIAPRAALRATAPAFERLDVPGGRLDVAGATASAPGWRSALSWHAGVLTPLRVVPATLRRVAVRVQVRDTAVWGDLPWGRMRLAAERTVPADPRPAEAQETVLFGQALLVRLTAPADAVQVSMGTGQAAVAASRWHGDSAVWSVPLADGSGSPASGTVWVSTRAVAWESFAAPVALHWSAIALGPLLRMQQMLGALHYLPVRWSGTSQATDACGCALGLGNPPAGSFAWRWPHVPAVLRAMWAPGTDNLITQGAVEAFDRVHGLPILPYATPAMWRDLVSAWEDRDLDPHAYTYVHVSETLPESLYLWRDGRVVLRSLVNTALPPGHTHVGTFPIHLRFASQAMSGTDPDDQPYYYPDVRWVSYFQGNDALHAFPRKAYGFPQSAGCVEMPLAKADTLWHLVHYGTLVTVVPPEGTGGAAASQSASASSAGPASA